ncbi:OsmC family protein [Nocardioides rotundus]|uniref:OsmC family protein n=1 Tax=Nocardioides rotundus TaxID=1774216 RepID=UPI001CBCBC99|nr:OsmC family protein [Nocardioides rotundus]UAL31405.1 OsmC family protein [Nocardioides rotundus]
MTEQAAETNPALGHRQVDLTRIGEGRYKATNARGGVLPIGSGGDPDFSPVELLLAGLAGCSAIDVDLITGKRAEAVTFDVRAEGVKVRDEQGNHLTDLKVTFDIRFPEGEEGDAARAVVPRSLEQTRDRLCSVGRTVALPSPVDYDQGDLSRP